MTRRGAGAAVRAVAARRHAARRRVARLRVRHRALRRRACRGSTSRSRRSAACPRRSRSSRRRIRRRTSRCGPRSPAGSSCASRRPHSVARLVAAAAAWTLCEWLRGFVFTGLPVARGGLCRAPVRRRAAARRLRAGRRRVPRVAGRGAVCRGDRRHHGCARAGAACARIVACLAGITRLVGDRRGAAPRVEWTTRARRPDRRCRSCRATCRRRRNSIRRSAAQLRAATTTSCALSKGRIVVLPESAYPQFADEIPGEVFLRQASVRPRAQRQTC